MLIATTLPKQEAPARGVKLSGPEVQALRQALYAAYGSDTGNARAQLDALALPYFEAADKNHFPQEDFLLLRLADAYRRKCEHLQAAEEVIAQEENLLVQTAAQALSVRLLEIYLHRRLEHYRRLLQAEKMPEAVSNKRIEKLRLRAVRACLRELCAKREWRLCLGVMHHYRLLLGEAVFGTYARAVRAGFAQDKGDEIWQLTDENLPLEERRKTALKTAEKETDPDLKTLLRAHICTLHEQALHGLRRKQSAVYAQLAQGKIADLSLLEPREIAAAAEISLKARTKQTGSFPEVFNHLYFEGSAQDIRRSWENGEISACDYLILMRTYYWREGGLEDAKAHELAQAVTLFCEKHQLPDASAAWAVYEVLRAPQERQAHRIQEIKQLYLLQENTK